MSSKVHCSSPCRPSVSGGLHQQRVALIVSTCLASRLSLRMLMSPLYEDCNHRMVTLVSSALPVECAYSVGELSPRGRQ